MPLINCAANLPVLVLTMLRAARAIHLKLAVFLTDIPPFQLTQ